MNKNMYNKKRLVLSIAVCVLLVTVAFSGVVAKDVKDKPDLDWDYWSNEPHMFSNVTGNVGIGTTNPSGKLEVVGDIVVSGLVDGIDIDVGFAALEADLAAEMLARIATDDDLQAQIIQEIADRIDDVDALMLTCRQL
jgi:hypothetical protein